MKNHRKRRRVEIRPGDMVVVKADPNRQRYQVRSVVQEGYSLIADIGDYTTDGMMDGMYGPIRSTIDVRELRRVRSSFDEKQRVIFDRALPPGEREFH